MDADAGQHKRKIVAFIGGLDLCLGRYDTPTHSLFRTLQTTHKDDFHNPNFEVSYPFFIFIVCLKSLSLDKIRSENNYKWWIVLTLQTGFCRVLLLVVQDNHGMICIPKLMVLLPMTSSPILRNAG